MLNFFSPSFMTTIDKAKQGGKKVVLAGCVPQGQKALSGLESYSVIGVRGLFAGWMD